MAYILKRLGYYLLAFWASVTLNFLLPRLMPGDPVSRMFARSGARLEITGIAVRDLDAPREPAVQRELLTTDAIAVATSNDLVIELIGGIEPARTLILAAFKAGASVITGNKALIAAHGPELYAAAEAADTDFYY